MEILKNPNFDFLGKSRYFIIASLLVIAAGVAFMFRPGGIRFGVEFSGGTQLIVRFQSSPQIDRIRTAVEVAAPGAVIQTYDNPAKNQVLIRLALAGSEDDLEGPAKTVRQALAERYSENPVVEHSSEIVGPIVGAELRQKAALLTLCGLAAQLTYIAIRFRVASGGGSRGDAAARGVAFVAFFVVFAVASRLALGGWFLPSLIGLGAGLLTLLPGATWGVAATVAVFHDVLVTLGFLAFCRFEITLNVLAALLTLVGYSVNDTIVIFDRVRENLRQRRKDSLAKIINDSLNQTLTRTIISNGTTFLAVLGLYLFGGEVLRGFGFAMVVGILVGTYSTIYIASPIVIWWQRVSSNKPPAAKAAL